MTLAYCFTPSSLDLGQQQSSASSTYGLRGGHFVWIWRKEGRKRVWLLVLCVSFYVCRGEKKFAILRILGATNCVSVGQIFAALHEVVGGWRTDKDPIRKHEGLCRMTKPFTLVLCRVVT